MVKKQQYEIVWTKRSQQHIRALYKHISKNSLQNSAMVIEDIVAAVEKAIPNRECYAPDKYKTGNDGSYRAFEKHRYRVAFRFTKNIIRVLSVRHTKMEPKQY